MASKHSAESSGYPVISRDGNYIAFYQVEDPWNERLEEGVASLIFKSTGPGGKAVDLGNHNHPISLSGDGRYLLYCKTYRDENGWWSGELHVYDRVSTNDRMVRAKDCPFDAVITDDAKYIAFGPNLFDWQ